ncbi:Nn.00g091100.m01.CDS01 [Neocucurbitaria sp. VM-36]
MKLLLEAGADPNNSDTKAYPPALKALCDASIAKFVFLLPHDADPNTLDNDGRSMVERVIGLPSTLSVLKLQALEVLLKQGAIVYADTTQSAPAFIAMAKRSSSESWDEVILHDLLNAIPLLQQSGQLDLVLEAVTSEKGVSRGDVSLFSLIMHCADPSCLEGGATSPLEYM